MLTHSPMSENRGTLSFISIAPTENTLGLEDGVKKQASVPALPADAKTGMLYLRTSEFRASSISRECGPLKERLIKLLPGVAVFMTYSMPFSNVVVVPSPSLFKILTEWMLAAFATPYSVPATLAATCVPN